MITSLRLVDFKNFADETLRAGPFTVIVGTNASGKSNIRDAFRFLHGIGRGYTLAEIIGGKFSSGSQVWAPIRGEVNEIVRFGQSGFVLDVELKIGEDKARYSIGVEHDKGNLSGFRVTEEKLSWSGSDEIFTSQPDDHGPDSVQDDATFLIRMGESGEQGKYVHRITARLDQPALTQIREHENVDRMHRVRIQQVIDTLAGIRFLDPLPDHMRKSAFPRQTVLGDSGENLPTVLEEICADPKRSAVLHDWARDLTPMDVKKFDFEHDSLTGRVRLVICETNKRKVSAYSASDGTLRFLAILAAMLGKRSTLPGLYVFEEIDNGIHPSRLWLLLDLIEEQASKGGLQMITTTHSPDLLAMIGDDTFYNTSVVCRLPDTDDSVIRRLCDLPRSKELRDSQGLGRLHASGWMEDVISFAVEDEEQAEC